jgi:hypothetical protein
MFNYSLKISDLHLDINSSRSVYINLVPIYQNRIIFAKNLSNKIFSPPRHQDTKLNYNNSCSLCLGAFVAILSLRGVGSTLRPVGPTGWKRSRRPRVSALLSRMYLAGRRTKVRLPAYSGTGGRKPLLVPP